MPDKVNRQIGLMTRRPESIEWSIGRSSCFLEDRLAAPARGQAGRRRFRTHRSWLCGIAALLVTGLVVGAVAEPPVGSPAPAPMAAGGPSPTPVPLPGANDTGEVPLPAAGSAMPAPDADPLFRTEPPLETDPAVEEAKRRATALLEAQNTQAATDALGRNTFQRAETIAESTFNGVGGVPRSLNPLFAVPGVADSPGLRLGPFLIHPVISAGINYESTTGSRSQGTSGFYGSISPAFTLTLGEPATGRSLSMVYTGSLSFGSDTSGREPYEQTFALNGTLNFTKLTLGVGLTYSQLSGADRDAGGQNVNRDLVGLSVNIGYIYSEKTSFSTTLSAPLRLFGQGSSSEGVNNTTFINYAYSPLTTVGVGFGLGTVSVESGSTQIFEQVLGRLSYVLTQRITFSGTAGYEFRDAGSKEEITPVFGLGLSWAVREGTALSLNAQRTIVNSAAQEGTNYTDTSLTASLSQRLGNSVQFSGTVGYENASYTGVERGVSTNRNDNQLLLQAALSTRLKNRWALTGTVSCAEDFSRQDSFRTVQTSLQLSYVY